MCPKDVTLGAITQLRVGQDQVAEGRLIMDLGRGRIWGDYTLVEKAYDCGRESASLSAVLTSSANDPTLSFRIT